MHAPTFRRSRAPNILQIDRGSDDFYVFQAELCALRDHGPVDADEGTPVVVEPVTVAALLVRVEVDAARLEGSWQISDFGYTHATAKYVRLPWPWR